MPWVSQPANIDLQAITPGLSLLVNAMSGFMMFSLKTRPSFFIPSFCLTFFRYYHNYGENWQFKVIHTYISHCCGDYFGAEWKK
jgi:hypothetical protein